MADSTSTWWVGKTHLTLKISENAVSPYLEQPFRKHWNFSDLPLKDA